MKIRRMSGKDNDYTFGQQAADFLVDSPEAVGQYVKNRLALETGQWFLNTDEGTPYSTAILGNNTQNSRDASVRERIANTPGVLSIDSYTSRLEGRDFFVTANITTIFGTTVVNASI